MPVELNDHSGMLASINTFKQVSMDIYNNYFLQGQTKYSDVMLVNAAFSIEVGLKYLISYDSGHYSTGHKWSSQWKQLNGKYRNCIILYLVDRCNNKNYTTAYIEESISELSNTFRDLRYSFEKSQIGIAPKFVMELMHAVAFVANYRYKSKEADLELFEMNCTAKMALDQKIKFDFKMP